MYDYTVPVFDRTLAALAAILTKAEAHCEARKIEPAALLTARLFPDMFTLTRQVQLSCDFAKGPAARMAGVEIPSFADTEVTFAELQTRIEKTRAFLAGLTPAQFEGAETRTIRFKARGQDHEAPGLAYFTRLAQQNFWFHVTTAYNILRHNGVELGKGDFIGG
jgi:uncharacterized protein